MSKMKFNADEMMVIDGCAGTWMATEECVVESQHFFLMQHEVYKEKAPNVIVDASGKLVSTEIRKGLDEDARKKILDYLYVELLLNSVERCIAIRPCDKNNPNAIRWGRLKEGRWCASTLGCRGLAKTLFDIMEWNEDLRYRFRGQFLEQGDNKMMLFAFDEPEMIKVEEIVLPPKENTEEDEGETVKKKIYIFPPEWVGTFGQPITSIAQVGILRQEHYAGNWDVFSPASEIEKMWMCRIPFTGQRVKL